MKFSKRRGRILVLACYLAVGAMVTQWGACWGLGANTLIGPLAANMVDANGNFLGIFNVCGIPDTITVDQTGQYGTIQNADDDLFTVCPVQVIQTTGSGT